MQLKENIVIHGYFGKMNVKKNKGNIDWGRLKFITKGAQIVFKETYNNYY